VIWWKRTALQTARKDLDSLQRIACLALTGAFKTTPTRALEILTGIPPLHLRIEAEARNAAYRLNRSNMWFASANTQRHTSIWNEMKENPIFTMPSDKCLPRYNFTQRFETTIPSREAWQTTEMNSIDCQSSNESIWFTDGSLKEGKSGAGICEIGSEVALAIPLGNFTSIYQAEILAILRCVHTTKEAENVKERTVIYSDSQAAIKALKKSTCTSKVTWECVQALNELAQFSAITVKWVPGHQGIQGNEDADELARRGAEEMLIGPEPATACAVDLPSNQIKGWLRQTSQTYWTQHNGCEHTKRLIEGLSLSRSKYLLSRARNQVRILIGAITGHYRFNSHLRRINIRDDPDCDYCGQEDTGEHFLCKCLYFQGTRLKYFGSATIGRAEFRTLPINTVWNFINGSRRFADVSMVG
jgi:ribonuclease HI